MKRFLYYFHSFIVILITMSGMSRYSSAQFISNNVVFKLLEVNDQRPIDDPLREANSLPFHGKLIYFYRRSSNTTVIVAREYANDSVKFSSFIVESPKNDVFNSIYGVELSNKGLISFRYGASDGEASDYQIYVLDPLKKSIYKVAPQFGSIAYKDYFWSPDGEYLSFLSGSDLTGKPKTNNDTTALYIYNVSQNSWNEVTRGHSLANNFVWAGQHDFYYSGPIVKSGLPPQRKIEQLKAEKYALFQFNPEMNKSRVLFEDCFLPSISNDGKKVLFWGTKSIGATELLQHKTGEIALYTATLEGANRQQIKVGKAFYPYLFWSLDNKTVISAGTISTGPQAQMEFIRWDVTTGQRLNTVTLTASDLINEKQLGVEPIDQPETFPRFDILGRYKDTFIVSSIVLTGLGENTQLKTQTILQAIDVVSGKVIPFGTAQIYDYGVPFNWTSK